MIRQEVVATGVIRTWSDKGVQIMNEIGVMYDEAYDAVPLVHTYTETTVPVPYREVSG